MEKANNKGGRSVDHNPFFFVLNAHQPPEWYMIYLKFGHSGIVLLIAIMQHMCRSRNFLLRLENPFYVSLEKDYGINIEQCNEVLAYAVESTKIYDEFLFKKGMLFSVDFLRNFDHARYFRDRKFKANQILDAINELREGQPPLTFEDPLEKIMLNAMKNNSAQKDSCEGFKDQE